MTKLSAKLAKIGDSYTVHQYDNGWMFEANGRNGEGDWITARIVCTDLDQVIALLIEAAGLPRDN